MRLVFAGTPEFAASALRALLDAGHEISLVLTQPDRPAGRGMSLQPSPVKRQALAAGIEVFQPNSLRDLEAQNRIRDVVPEVMVVAAYGLILPQAVLDIPRLGCLNIHASLLPRWRGAAPIQRAILAGDAETGVCIMQMEAGLDTGPVLRSHAIPIAGDDTAGTVHDKLAELGARLVVGTLAELPITARPQPESGVTYAAKIEKAEARLDWRLPAAEVERRVRAFNPFPGALASFDGHSVKVWRAECVPTEGEPGRILAADKHGIVVGCGQNALRLLELQKAGGRRLSADQLLAGTPLSVGTSFDLAA
ncbi:methionyl-tRNA formyltransferase [Propionivibrio soli]|uniref:methionyl-tRNA formyltransferase n=1 Tax=Propionivibrio soli TaxID=2976531 RepID=UPI0021E8A556|nr:methionyl-tRNA formyltransferase [Propionivibrio soli]